MHPFVAQLATGITTCGLKGQQIVVGVSGGADSVALLRGLCELRASANLMLVAAHLNHQLRGSAADDDAAWVADLAERMLVPVHIGRLDIAALAVESKRGVEETARRARYQFLTGIALESGCTHIAVAHTANDQAETILHHILRGTGLAGLRGMPASRPLAEGITLTRPLLDVSRNLVVAYLTELGQSFREDHTNAETSFTRNRLRHEILPLLRGEHPHVDSAILRLGKQATELHEPFVAGARTLLRGLILEQSPHRVLLNWRPLAHESRPLVRECFVQLWCAQDWPRRKMSAEKWEELANLAVTGGTGMFPGGIRVQRIRRGMLLEWGNPTR